MIDKPNLSWRNFPPYPVRGALVSEADSVSLPALQPNLNLDIPCSKEYDCIRPAMPLISFS